MRGNGVVDPVREKRSINEKNKNQRRRRDSSCGSPFQGALNLVNKRLGAAMRELVL